VNITWHMPTLRGDSCGLSTRALALAEQLLPRGHYVDFVVDETKTDLTGNAIGALPLRRLRVPSAKAPHWSLQASAKRRNADAIARKIGRNHDVLISCQPEVVSAYADVFGRRPLIFVCGGTTLLHDAADRAEQPSLGPSARLAFALDRYLKNCNETNAFTAADVTVFDSASTRSLAVARYRLDPGRCFVVHGGVDLDAFRQPDDQARRQARTTLGIPDTDCVVAWTGRMSPEKHVGLLVRAAAACHRRPSAVLLIGDGPLRDTLARRVRQTGLQDIVRFLGRQPDVRSFLHAADVYAFPSRCESFGGSLVEAMACGLACVAQRANGRIVRNASAEIIEHGRSGLLVDRPDPIEWAAALDRLAADRPLRRRLGAAARQRVERRFTWTAGGRRLAELIEGLTSGTWSRPHPLLEQELHVV